MKLLELVLRKKKQLLISLFIIYTVFIVWFTILNREPRELERVLKPELFWAFQAFLSGQDNGKLEAIQYIKNIAFFIPFGALIPLKKWNKVLLISIVSSVVIEVIQYIFNIGWCEIDDVVSNVMGAMIGFGLSIKFGKIYQKYWGK